MKKNPKNKGYKSIVFKNAKWQFSTSLLSKAGSLIFTIIIARLLLPELFGLYSLALSTIFIFASFADLCVVQTLVRFVSKALGRKNKKKARVYIKYLTKIKIWLTIATMAILILAAKFIAQNYYHKPIFLALMAGSLYILFSTFSFYLALIFQSANNFKYPFYWMLYFQISRLIVVPLIIIFSLKYLSSQLTIFFIILGLALAFLISLVYATFILHKKLSFIFKKSKEQLKNKEKKKANKFILALTVTVLSAVFFGYIDIIMLGHFVQAEFIGYYKAALSLIGGIGALIAFSPVLFPVFSRIKGKRLERSLNKSIKVTLILSAIFFIGTLAFANLIIKIAYGNAYLASVSILYLLSLLLISLPLSSVYAVYYVAKDKPFVIAKLFVIATFLNIILNYIFITWLLHYSMFMATIGAGIATIISRYFYLGGLVWIRKKSPNKIQNEYRKI